MILSFSEPIIYNHLTIMQEETTNTTTPITEEGAVTAVATEVTEMPVAEVADMTPAVEVAEMPVTTEEAVPSTTEGEIAA